MSVSFSLKELYLIYRLLIISMIFSSCAFIPRKPDLSHGDLKNIEYEEIKKKDLDNVHYGCYPSTIVFEHMYLVEKENDKVYFELYYFVKRMILSPGKKIELKPVYYKLNNKKIKYYKADKYIFYKEDGDFYLLKFSSNQKEYDRKTIFQYEMEKNYFNEKNIYDGLFIKLNKLKLKEIFDKFKWVGKENIPVWIER